MVKGVEAINNMIELTGSFESKLNLLILELVKRHESEVFKMIVEEQLFQGIDSDGQVIKPPYAESTVDRKKRLGHPHDRVTTRDKKDFHNSFFNEYREDDFVIGNDDEKARYLALRYGNAIIGLTKENVSALAGIIYDELIEESKKILSL